MTTSLQFRGVYFASHFDNSYRTWPTGDVEALIDDYVDLGANRFMNWLDLNEINRAELDRPGTQAHQYLQQVRAMLNAARRRGMKIIAGVLANACSIDQYDPALAADTRGWSGRSAYKHQLCLSNARARAICLQNALDIVRLLSPVDALSIWTYDQGGCDCPRCAPYSSICARFAREVQDALGSSVEVMLSAWHMPDDQADAMLHTIASAWDKPPVLFFNHDSRPHHHGPDVGRLRRMQHFDRVRAVAFPEITMLQDDTQVGTFAWNLFGANPMPRYFTDRLRQQRRWMHGLLTYSEGPYDHINQYALLRAAQSGDLSVDRLMADYAQRYLTASVADSWVQLIHRLEQNWLHLDDEESSGRTLRLADAIAEALPGTVRAGWRWRLVHLRASLDHLAARARQGGLASVQAALDEQFAQLAGLYLATPRTWPPINTARLMQSPGCWLPPLKERQS
jgi:hypothetical protein